MSEDEIQCMDCSKNIIKPENDFLLYMSPLTKEEKLSALNYLIESQNLDSITTGVCVSCLYEYLISVRERLNEEEEKHRDCINALKDSLFVFSQNKEIDKIAKNFDTGVDEAEEKELEEKVDTLIKRRKSLEKKIKEQKKIFGKLKEEENNIYFKLNENERKNEEETKHKEKLIMKKQYLQKYYEKVIKEK